MPSFEEFDLFSFALPKYKITKPIRLIELFGGIGSQAKALENLGANFEHYKLVEFDKYAVASYNQVHHTQFSTQDITLTHANDLEIVDRDNYTYILTYSFPCQDLSLAGKGRGYSKGEDGKGHTRSGLLWEVERILDECNGELPQVLLMENVPQVHSVGENMRNFQSWLNKLESLGYKNYWKDLNAKNYGIPQNRNRCFCVSLLSENGVDYHYQFPRPIKLKLRLKDMLEENVDEKYYLSDSMIKYITADNEKWTGNNNKALINKNIASTINTGEGSRRCDASNYVDDSQEEYDLKPKVIGNQFNSKHEAGRVFDGGGVVTNNQRKSWISCKSKS